ncbi:hypothetical protein KIL84_002381 [Mauremys mutica]|uniref:Uncharacterized protein n=1 Tax=Mauremys mutica TaxID=74926 RepID=A0A9D4AS83_9SAUR|nr:hypothetical protein KIL84_002381 [Mauremys mutica]
MPEYSTSQLTNFVSYREPMTSLRNPGALLLHVACRDETPSQGPAALLSCEKKPELDTLEAATTTKHLALCLPAELELSELLARRVPSMLRHIITCITSFRTIGP